MNNKRRVERAMLSEEGRGIGKTGGKVRGEDTGDTGIFIYYDRRQRDVADEFIVDGQFC